MGVKRRGRGLQRSKRQQERVTIHQGLLLVRAADADQLEQLLKRVDVRSRLVRRLDEQRVLLSTTGLPALRKRLAALGLTEALVELVPRA